MTLSNALDLFLNANSMGFTSNGSYTPNPNVVYIRVQVQAGGGGAGATDITAGEGSAASGGGAGGYCEAYLNVGTLLPGPIAVTVGAGGVGASSPAGSGGNGGNSSFGTFLVANGGTGGTGIPATSGQASTIGADIGRGGTATGGMFNVTGGDGGFGFVNYTSLYAFGGKGGDSFLGYGGEGEYNVPAAGVVGQPSTGYGSGGSAFAQVVPFGVQNGNDGQGGIVIITEFTR